MAYNFLQQALEREYQLSLQKLAEQIADRQRQIAEQVTARGLFGGGTHFGELSALAGEEARARGEIESTRLRQLAEIIRAREEEARAKREAQKALRGQMLAKLVEVGLPLILPGIGKMAKFGLPLLLSRLGQRTREVSPTSTLLPRGWQESLKPRVDIGPVNTPPLSVPPFEWRGRQIEPVNVYDISKLAQQWVERERGMKEKSLFPAYRYVPPETQLSIVGNKTQGIFRPRGRHYSLLPQGWQRTFGIRS